MAHFTPPSNTAGEPYAGVSDAGSPLDLPHTRAAEGLERVAFSLVDVHRMMEADVLSPEGAWELLEGEIVWMSPGSIRHGRLAAKLDRFLAANLPDELQCLPDTRVDIPPNSQPGPDIVVFDAAYDGEGAVPVDRIQLVIEVAASTLQKDLGLKAQIYAAAGAPEYWVVDATAEQLIVHRGPKPGGWSAIARHSFTHAVSPLCAPDLAVAIAAL